MSSKCRPVVGSSNMKRRAARLFALRACGLRRFREEARQLQALRLAARKRRHRLAELHVFQPDVDDRLQHAQHFGILGKQRDGFADRQFEHVGDAQRTRRLPRSIFTSSSSAR